MYEAHFDNMMKFFDQSKKNARYSRTTNSDLFRVISMIKKNLSNARLKFRIHAKMVEIVPRNLKNQYKYNETDLS